ncbi:MAG: DUF4838 domain-containing protein, partial [Gemmatimonadetes bacterium]|nr:DUF4838 domain-containing protein [Gemmatimonadota bacterium]
HGAYTLLEKLGFRWFFKNPAWHVRPKSLATLDFDEVHEPAFEYRRLFYWEPRRVDGERLAAWQKYNRMPGRGEVNTAHTYRPYIVTDDELQANPDWGCGSQIDVTNPDVVQQGIEFARSGLAGNPDWLSTSVEPADNADWSGCPFAADRQTITDAVFTFTNQVAGAVKAEFPGRYVSTLSYSAHSGLPNVERFEDNVLVLMATNYSALPVRTRLEHFAERGAKVGIYDYTLLNGKGLRQYINNIRLLNELGGTVYYDEGGGYWAQRGLTYYVNSKLCWDPTLGVEQIKQDFYDKAFGPVGGTMKRYFERHYTQDYAKRRVLALAFNDLARAAQEAVGQPDILERLRHLQYYLRYQWQTVYEEPYDTTDPAQEQQWSDFLCSLVDTNVLWNYFYAYEYGGLSRYWNRYSSQSPPTLEQAQEWMNQALAAFSNEPLIEVPVIDLDDLDLALLGDAQRPVLPVARTLVRGTLLIKIDAARISQGNALIITATSPGSAEDPSSTTYPRLSWTSPEGMVTQISPTTSPQQIALPLFGPGLYQLKFWTFWCCSGTFKFEGIDAPAALSADSFDHAEGVSGYFVVPENTPAFAVYNKTTWTTRAGNIILADPSDTVVLDEAMPFQDGASGEWIIENPVPGLWRLDITHQGRAHVELYGVPPLLWHDANLLLAPSTNVR